MTVFPKMLKRHSHDAELALIDRIHFARHISGIGGCPEWQKLLYNSRTFSLLYFSRDLATPHFSKFCGQNFKLKLLTHFLMDFLKT